MANQEDFQRWKATELILTPQVNPSADAGTVYVSEQELYRFFKPTLMLVSPFALRVFCQPRPFLMLCHLNVNPIQLILTLQPLFYSPTRVDPSLNTFTSWGWTGVFWEINQHRWHCYSSYQLSEPCDCLLNYAMIYQLCVNDNNTAKT